MILSFENNDLLPKSGIRAVDIDNQNQKWIGTENQGLFRINDIGAKFSVSQKETAVCFNESIVFSDSSTTIGDGISRWLWDFGDGNTSTEQNPRHRYQRGGLYYVSLTVTDQNGSQNTARDTILVYPDEYHRLNNERDISTCQPVRLDFYSVNPVRWTLPNGTVADTQFVQANQSGLYRVQTVAGRCLFKDSVLVTFRGESATGINLIDENGEMLKETVSGFPPVDIIAASAVEFCAYTWRLNGDSIGSLPNQSMTLNEPGTYTIRLEALDFSGCKYVGERLITFENGKIPNIVTANGDGLNDFFEIRSSQTKKLSIHNRWGKTVFQTDNYQNNWPASDDKPGTYFYRLEMGEQVFTGWLEVVR
jgi:gliding motility-associated-like protein